MKRTRFVVVVAIIYISAPATTIAAFVVEADNVAPEGKAFDHFVSTPPGSGFQLSAAASTALGLTGNQSAFGNPANATGPDRYEFVYTPGVDIDNTVFIAGTSLGNSSAIDIDGAGPGLPAYNIAPPLATGLVGGLSGMYNVYFTVPATANVNTAGSTITVFNNGSPVILNPVLMNNGGTGPDEVAGGTFTGGANNRWLRIGTVPLLSGNSYSVVVEANALPPDFVSQRAHGVMWEYAGPLPPPPPAGTQELLNNGDFEAGFAGWAVNNLLGGSGDWYLSTPGSPTPLSNIPTAPNAGGGALYAVTDQTGPGTHVLRQTFTVPADAISIALSFEMFVNDSDGGPIVHPNGLDHTAFPNQHSRVDILTPTAGPFSTAPSDIVQTFYVGVDPQISNPNPYTPYSFDLTGIVAPGQSYQIRFAEVDNQLFMNHGVDNVSITALVIPEPTEVILITLYVATNAIRMPRRRRRS
jgi:hypothetical protein